MILTKPEILKEITEKRIKIEPFDKNSVGPASIDLTLDNKLRVFNSKETIISENIDYEKITKVIDISKGYLLVPGQLVLGITKEKITLPENICGWLNSRSRFARIGLMSHITAPFIAPGISNHQVLEIYNAGLNTIKLIPGTKICQLVFQECKGKAKYQGKFKNQRL
ncbi:MAG: dCTP deaminase [Candidatus Pacearchaeota archaeon]|jgi:dCTP deaminase